MQKVQPIASLLRFSHPFIRCLIPEILAGDAPHTCDAVHVKDKLSEMVTVVSLSFFVVRQNGGKTAQFIFHRSKK
jgi:hypothetical protein